MSKFKFQMSNQAQMSNFKYQKKYLDFGFCHLFDIGALKFGFTLVLLPA